MRPLRTFTVEPSLPEPLAPLRELAMDLRWSWDGQTQDLFRRMDPELWEQCQHNPVALLGGMHQERLAALAADEGFLAHLRRVHADCRAYHERRGWWARTHGGGREPQVAYFCAEFGITDCLPIYSGGLGVLAGDHLKSASDLDVPLVGVGLLYQQGYFRQRLNADGWQLELYPRNDFHNLPVELVLAENGLPRTVSLDLPGGPCRVQAWRAQVGRVSLYLLDTNVAENAPEDRHITAQLYGGDQENRIRQEIVLGIGGVRMLAALGVRPKVFHMNEGHSAFLALERIRMLMEGQNVSFDEAREAVAASNVFTTHTPVPAGNDAFEPWLIEKYIAAYWPQLGLDRDGLLALGRQEPDNADEPMNLTVLALRMSSSRNAVSQLHRSYSRQLWANVWPGVPHHELPIAGVTNGVHTPSWISHDMGSLCDRYLGPGWHEKPADAATWQAVYRIPDAELWRTHERRRERLVAFARARRAEKLRARGAGSAELDAAREMLDPEALTIGFARRFATYKRATLLFTDPDRLNRLLNAPGRRVQIIFAGKAHPRDNPGKDLIRAITHQARKEEFRHALVFLEDYDLNVARYLVQGVDVWLNTPLRPMEASGTSGMKVAANGGLNLSILDGWWAEGYHPDVGWAIGAGETYEDLEYQNAVESQTLYDLLEKEVVPLFYDRGPDNLPRRWIAKMKAAMARLAPVYNTARMVREYAEQFYAPAAARWDELTADGLARARQLSAWRRKVRAGFQQVRVESVRDNMADESSARVGGTVDVQAVVCLGDLAPDDVTVELYYGRLDTDGQLTEGIPLPMRQAGPAENNHLTYAVQMPCTHSGLTGYTVRVRPRHDLLPHDHDMATIRWA